MNDNPHLLAILESKMAQARLHQQHNSLEKADDLLAQIKIYAEALKPNAVTH